MLLCRLGSSGLRATYKRMNNGYKMRLQIRLRFIFGGNDVNCLVKRVIRVLHLKHFMRAPLMLVNMFDVDTYRSVYLSDL